MSNKHSETAIKVKQSLLYNVVVIHRFSDEVEEAEAFLGGLEHLADQHSAVAAGSQVILLHIVNLDVAQQRGLLHFAGADLHQALAQVVGDLLGHHAVVLVGGVVPHELPHPLCAREHLARRALVDEGEVPVDGAQRARASS